MDSKHQPNDSLEKSLFQMANFNTPYETEREGQMEFFDNYGISLFILFHAKLRVLSARHRYGFPHPSHVPEPPNGNAAGSNTRRVRENRS